MLSFLDIVESALRYEVMINRRQSYSPMVNNVKMKLNNITLISMVKCWKVQWKYDQFHVKI